MYKITYFNRRLGRTVVTKFDDIDSAKKVADKVFRVTGIIVGIERA